MNDENDLPPAIHGDTPESSPPLPPTEARGSSVWWLLLILFVPMGVLILVPMGVSLLGLQGSREVGYAAFDIVRIPFLLACPAAGIAAGFLFAGRLRKLTDGQRIAAGFGMSIVFTVASAALAFGGCMFLGWSMSR